MLKTDHWNPSINSQGQEQIRVINFLSLDLISDVFTK